MKSLKFNIRTFGCKVNQYESEQMKRLLQQNGFVCCKNIEDTDIFIINSCTVTNNVDREIKRFIRKLTRENPAIKIMVAGCLAETIEDRQELSNMSAVKWLVKNSEKSNIHLILNPMLKNDPKIDLQPVKKGDRDRVFIKIQDGCDNACSYCKTTIVRGKSVSRPFQDILNEVKSVLEQGYNEIVFTGICLGDWGKDLHSKRNIVDILKEIVGFNGDFRIRLSSIEPLLISDELLDLMRENSKICRHLHIPLQSGDTGVLKRMNRKYTSEEFLLLIEKIREKIPEIGITTDVIVGFPGEDDMAFENTYDLIKKIQPIRVHVFTYSRRIGTKAYSFKEDVSVDITRKRQKKLQELVCDITEKYAKALKDKEQYVLVESEKDKDLKYFSGYTDTYLRVFLQNAKIKDIGKIVPIIIRKAENNVILGEIVG
ncbi:MAG: tRNA (N(6)-L-threonylcarbamoyladenosine(37)-C(2))-methylthiotransferase MtaB [Candidatus Omnitrophica bacterium]|nr:tRNA (N(6)-L-threonylcarbamoyladenosine(37)-C(2))-methylthiotransferase MtaB [Candidatus Omnitrophota bacterium]